MSPEEGDAHSTFQFFLYLCGFADSVLFRDSGSKSPLCFGRRITQYPFGKTDIHRMSCAPPSPLVTTRRKSGKHAGFRCLLYMLLPYGVRPAGVLREASTGTECRYEVRSDPSLYIIYASIRAGFRIDCVQMICCGIGKIIFRHRNLPGCRQTISGTCPGNSP